MRNFHVLLLVGLLAAFLAVGCDESDEDTETDGGPGTPTADAGTDGGEADSTVDDDSDGGEMDGGDDGGDGSAKVSEDEGACTNPTDLAGVQRTDYGATGNQDITGLTKTVGLLCLSQPSLDARIACMKRELAGAVDDAMTEDCQACFVDTVACAMSNCMAQCAANPDSDGCTKCRCENDCVDAWIDCTGLPTTTACE